jgi:hypothetical protein
MGPAHSFIRPENPFMRQVAGTPVEVAETVHTHEIIISAVEAAKRYKAECGGVPEGFINSLREQYPEGVPAGIVDDLIKAGKPKADSPISTGGWVIKGGDAAPSGESPAAENKSKIA